MIRRLLLLTVLTLAFASTVASAEDEEKKIETGRWYNFLEAGLNLTQSSYSDNWKGGENGSIAWTAVVNASTQRRFENDLDWLSTLQLRFGQTHQRKLQEDGVKRWERPEKSEDKIDFETILRLIKGWELDPYASGRLESQFLDVSDPNGRDLTFNPITLKESAGVSHRFYELEEEFVLTRLGFTARQNLRKLFVNPAGRATNSELSNDMGIEFQADWNIRFSEDQITWLSKMSVYKPFYWSKADRFDDVTADSLLAAGLDSDVKDFTTDIDISWENTFSTKITKLISLNLYVQWLYDKYDNSVVPEIENGAITNAADVDAAVRKAGQFKQTFAIGITYQFL